MPYFPSDAIGPLLIQAQRTLNCTQEELGELLGVSRKTVGRWGGGAAPSSDQVVKLARLVFPKDPALAAALAAEVAGTLESFGIVAPKPLPAPPPPPPPPPRPFPPAHVLAESIVCAAAEALDTTPGAVRHVVRAAFARAKETGLGVDEVCRALAPPPSPEPGEKNAGARAKTR